MDIGANSVVWLASNKFTGEKVALRQIPKDFGTASDLELNEMSFYETVFNHTGMLDTTPQSNKNLQDFEGLNYIVKLNEKIEDDKDSWFSYPIGRKSLSEWMFSKKM